MRIISGINKGMKLYAPEGQNVRPTSDKIKEAIFNIIGQIDEKATVLDLFAGSGSIGIEFLARGAKHATFVDSSTKSLSYVKKNLELGKFMDKSTIIQKDYDKAIAYLSHNNQKFNYIFADPPYDYKLSSSILNNIINYSLISKEGLLIIETEKDERLFEDIEINSLNYKEKVYGRTRISIIKF